MKRSLCTTTNQARRLPDMFRHICYSGATDRSMRECDGWWRRGQTPPSCDQIPWLDSFCRQGPENHWPSFMYVYNLNKWGQRGITSHYIHINTRACIQTNNNYDKPVVSQCVWMQIYEYNLKFSINKKQLPTTKINLPYITEVTNKALFE